MRVDEARKGVYPLPVDELGRLGELTLVALADPALGDPDRDVGDDAVLLVASAAEERRPRS